MGQSMRYVASARLRSPIETQARSWDFVASDAAARRGRRGESMSVVFILAHFDDEYCALPLMLEAQAAGEPSWFLYVADYRDPADAARRLRETRDFLRRFGFDGDRAIHVGEGSGVLDGAVAEGIGTAIVRIRQALAKLPPPGRFVTPAW